jgi:uncharacterized protein
MTHRSAFASVWLGVAISLSTPYVVESQAPSLVDLATHGTLDEVRALLKGGAEVNASRGDGVTALHVAAETGNLELASVLLAAGADVTARTRLGGYTPLLIASKSGQAVLVGALLSHGADPNVTNVNGTSALMFGAESGNIEVVSALITRGAKADTAEKALGQTALMFAAAHGRADVVPLLIAHGADPNIKAKAIDVRPFLEEEILERKEAATKAADPKAGVGQDKQYVDPKPNSERRYTFTEEVGGWGGLTALHFAARQGELETVKALLAAGADLNARSSGNETTPLLIATLNGHFDVAKHLLDAGADPSYAQDNGVTALYAVVNVQWALKSFYPQPRAQYQQRTSYLELMTALLDRGADPQARTTRKVWTTNFSVDWSGVDDVGATPFWRAAYAADVDAMRLLVSRGADPNIPTTRTINKRREDGSRHVDKSGLPPVPIDGPGIPPLLAAAGPGYGFSSAGNVHRVVPAGMLPAVKYLLEELHMDVNVRDHDGNTALHNAASRGDNKMIQYLIEKGADPHAVNRFGYTTVDMANGPFSRAVPFLDTIALLEKLGVKNNHMCVSC